MKRVLSALALLLAACASAPAQSQAPAARPTDEARIEAYVAALSEDDPAAFERASQEHLTPALLAARTPAQRAEMYQRVHGDFGALEIMSVDINGPAATVIVRGATGMVGTFQFTFEGADSKIAGAAMRVEMGGNEREAPSIPPPPITAAMSADQMDAALNRWITPFVAADDFAGVVMIARDGQPFVTRAYGPAVRAPNTPANTETAYNIASIGKRFTKTAIARLIQEGRLSLDTTIGDVIPDYANAEARGATVRQLVDMQGGVADIFSPEREQAPRSLFTSNHGYYQFVSSLPQRFAPGAREEYCNGCYVVLGEMIERITGEPFETYIQRVVLTPADMTRTGYFNSDRLPANTAIAYIRNEQDAWDVAGEGRGISGSGAGGVYSTAADLLKFDDALRTGRLLDPQWSAWTLGGDEVVNGRNVSALAVQGGSPGVRAELDSNGRWSVVILANVHGPLSFDIAEALARALGI